MRTLIVTTFLSADGVMEAPGGGEHPHAGWTFKDVEFDPAAYELKGSEQQAADAIMMGRISYQEFAPVWPTMPEFASFNEGEKYVVSTTLATDTDTDTDTDPDTDTKTVPWGDFDPVTVLGSIDDVARLKEGDGGPILVQGSARLAQSLAAAGLVDRYHLLLFPVLLGGGKRLFAEGVDKQKLTLTDSAAYGNGVVKLVYDVVGATDPEGEGGR